MDKWQGTYKRRPKNLLRKVIALIVVDHNLDIQYQTTACLNKATLNLLLLIKIWPIDCARTNLNELKNTTIFDLETKNDPKSWN